MPGQSGINRSLTTNRQVLAHGAKPLTTAAEVAATTDFVICVTGAPQVKDMVFGDNGILQALKPGCVVVDCSTSLPDSTRRAAQAIAAKGGRFLDAAMTGTPQHADEGKFNPLVGDDPDVLAKVPPVFALFAENIFYCGAFSAGHTAKLLHRFVALGNAAILAEAFSCASKTGVNLEVRCDVIACGGANCTAFQSFRPCVLEGHDHLFRFSLANAHRDMHCYAQMIGEAQAVTLIGDTVHNVYTMAGNLGYKTVFVPHSLSSFDRLNGARWGRMASAYPSPI